MVLSNMVILPPAREIRWNVLQRNFVPFIWVPGFVKHLAKPDSALCGLNTQGTSIYNLIGDKWDSVFVADLQELLSYQCFYVNVKFGVWFFSGKAKFRVFENVILKKLKNQYKTARVTNTIWIVDWGEHDTWLWGIVSETSENIRNRNCKGWVWIIIYWIRSEYVSHNFL